MPETKRNMFRCRHDTFTPYSNNPQSRCTTYGHWGSWDKELSHSTFCKECNNLNSCDSCDYKNSDITVWNGDTYVNPCSVCSNSK